MIDWINNYFSIGNEVSVPTLISIIVFIIGGIVTYLYSALKEFTVRKRLKTSFFLLLDQSIKDLRNKERIMADFVSTISLENRTGWILPYSSVRYLENFFEMDFNTIYLSFRRNWFWSCNKKIKQKSFNRLWSILRNIRYFEDRIDKNIDGLTSRFTHYHNQYMEYIDEYRKHHDNLLMRYEGKTIKTQYLLKYLEELDVIWINWQNQDESLRTNFYITYTSLVVPSLELSKQFLPNELVAHETDDILLKCTHNYIELENTLKIYNQSFRNYIFMYKEAHKILNKCRDILQAKC